MLIAISVWMMIQIILWFMKKGVPKRSEWVVVAMLWSMSVAMSVVVQSAWNHVEPLAWSRSIFEPATKWIMEKV